MMRHDFLADAEVSEFSQWLAVELPKLPVRLDIARSPYMPDGLRAECTFALLLPEHYQWRLAGMVTGDWRETLLRMHGLSTSLRESASRGDVPGTHAACEAIAEWGADRNGRVGASAFLHDLGDDLPGYLERTGKAISLAAPDASGSFRSVRRMNSTLTKIHALFAVDGLPIYESRVAVAIATLVEMWRRRTGRDMSALSPALRFPAVGGQLQRRVRWTYPDAADPGVLSYNSGSEIATAARWASATVRLGLLMEATLERSAPDLFVAWAERRGSHTKAARMAAFVGSLYMVGYNPVCMRSERMERPKSDFLHASH